MKENKYLLSLFWIFLTVNYIYCDVFSLLDSTFLNELLTGKVGEIEFTESFILFFSIILEIPMLMIILSVLLKAKTSLITNVIAAIFMILIQTGSLSVGKNSLHYIFFSIIEISTLVFIIYKSWVWYKQMQLSTTN